MSLKSEEFYMRYLVIAHRKKQGTKFYSQLLEKELLKSIDSPVEDSYSKEYLFQPGISELEKRMFRVFKSHKAYFSTAIKFTQNSMYVYEEGKGFKTKPMSFDELPNLNPAVSSLLSLYKKPKKPKKRVTYKFKGKNLKKH